jgi:cardiolipin synthase
MRALALGLALALAACGSSPGPAGTDPDAPTGPPGIDAPPPDAHTLHCKPTDPRTAAPTTFVTPAGFEQRMQDTIAGAKHTLDVQMNLFTLQSLATAVIDAHGRGVAVRVLLDPDQVGNNQTRQRLTDAGVPHKNAPAGFPEAHAKYVIVDGAAVTITSASWNAAASIDERDYGMVDTDPDDVADARAVFDADWTGAAASLACTRLLIAPGAARQRVLDLIAGAATTLDLEVLIVTDPDVLAAVEAAHTRGVAVRVILANPATTPDNTATRTELTQHAVPVRVITTFPLHATLVVADGTALIGSANLTAASLGENRELGALVFEPGALAPVTAQLDADWAAATP